MVAASNPALAAKEEGSLVADPFAHSGKWQRERVPVVDTPFLFSGEER